MIYHVDGKVNYSGDGSMERPFKKISEAALCAMPGDEVLVEPGIYREYVDPKNGGTAEKRITYRSVIKGAAVITGAERVTGWKLVEGDVWTARVPGSLFGSYNPYTTLVSGDWFVATFIAHTGDVYLNGKSMYEVTEPEKVFHPEVSYTSWDPDFSVYTWYASQDTETDEIVFWANFQGKDPNQEEVEISVRENCFYPSKEGRGYITLSGFTICKAATQWAPPTAYQEGMVGPHWSKGWIIEDCDISESKCSGISLGKYRQEGNDNKWLKWKYKDGTQTERDCILQAEREGWSKENIGSHIIRRCTIHDCGQTGIVGHLGGVFSLIEDNHIYNINNKRNLAGAEIGGIKMHAAIDVIYRRNVIHHCTRGLWLDWQAQGTRVTQNLFYDNELPHVFDPAYPDDGDAVGEDVFLEVSHGPTLFDNNFFLSPIALKVPTQGMAFVHNLIAGSFASVGIGTDNGAATLSSPRYTPYQLHHETGVAGFMTFLHGDNRFYNNIFVQQKKREDLIALYEHTKAHPNCWNDYNLETGTAIFDGYPSFAEWDAQFEGYCGMGSAPSDRYYSHLPIWSKGNVYLNGASAWEKEQDALRDQTREVTFSIREENGAWKLATNLYDVLKELIREKECTWTLINTDTLGMAFEPEQRFENPDGSDIFFDEDYFGHRRGTNVLPGPSAEGGSVFRLK